MPPRLLRPKDESPVSNGSKKTNSSVSKSSQLVDAGDIGSDTKAASKRRAVSSACIPCRKRKSKCDGGVPSCSTCVAVYRTDCAYDADSDHRRKGALKKDIHLLQQQNHTLDIILAQLQSLPEPEAISLLHSIRTDTNIDVIAATLRNNVNLPNCRAAHTLEADFISQPGPPSASSSDPAITTPSVNANGLSSWFGSLQDHDMIEHLLELYFSWIHPFHQLFSKEHFQFDLRNGRRENCSSLLLSAILAFACHYSDRQFARTNYYNPATAGDHFFAEAKKLLEEGGKPSLTTTQALGVMSLRETSQGRESSGYQYAGRCVRMAIELGLHLPMPAGAQHSLDAELRSLTFWSVFGLESISSIGLGRISQLPQSAIGVEKPSPVERLERQPWKAYEDTSTTSISQALQPITFTNVLTQLCELATEMINTFYAPRESFTSRKLAATYKQYQEWYSALPETLWLKNTTLPHVVVLHMLYQFCVLHLFRPYIKLDLRGANLFPREACSLAANEISDMMNMLRTMHGLRRTCLTVTTILLSSSTIHLLNLPQEHAVASLVQGMCDLQEISVNHPYAARCLDTLRSLAVRWNIALPDDAIMRSYQLPGSLSSAATSIFYAASIPQDQSSGSRDRSMADSVPKHESSFAPPDSQSMQDYDSVMAQHILPAQMPFISPFPGNGMPIRATAPEQAYRDMQHVSANDWPSYALQQQDLRRQSAAEHSDENNSPHHTTWPWDR